MRDQRQPVSRGSPYTARHSYERRRCIAPGALAFVLVAVIACGVVRPRQDVDEVARTITDRLTAGDYREAERLANDACDRVSRSQGTESVEFARLQDQLVAALVKNGKGGTPEAWTAAERALRAKEAALGRDHAEAAYTLHNLGLVRLSREDCRTGAALRRLIWDPIAPYLRGASRIFVVPDGAIGLVPFAALPVGESSYLLEEWPPISYLSAERDLVATTVPRRASARGMLALGGPAFDEAIPAAATSASHTPAPAVPVAAAAGTRSVSGCASLQNLQFQPLGGTLAEVEELSRLWAARRSAEPARVLLRREASETTFKQSAHEYRVLHVATHGFFLSDACGTVAAAGTRGVAGWPAHTRVPRRTRCCSPAWPWPGRTAVRPQRRTTTTAS